MKLNLDRYDIGEVRYDEPMSEHTTFRIGGPCDVMILPSSEEQLRNALVALKENDINYMVIGNGSNLLINDNGLRGAVIKLGDNYNEITVDGEYITAQSGALITAVSRRAASESLTGLEFSNGIPGAIGGAMMMNAGAYGGEFKNVVDSVVAMSPDGEVRTYSVDEMNFRYRGSRIGDENLIVLSATMKLEKGEQEEIAATMKDLTQRRTSKQPLELPSAGSTFKRPEGYFAGQLIEEAGLKGVQVGGAQVSTKHSGFIVNIDNATAKDVMELIDVVKKTVYDINGVMLEPEVKLIKEEL